MVETESKKVSGAIGSPNESRRRLNLKPVEGGDDVYSQQQNWSLKALARRDEMALTPPATPTALPQGTEDTITPEEEALEDPEATKALLAFKVMRGLKRVAA